MPIICQAEKIGNEPGDLLPYFRRQTQHTRAKAPAASRASVDGSGTAAETLSKVPRSGVTGESGNTGSPALIEVRTPE